MNMFTFAIQGTTYLYSLILIFSSTLYLTRVHRNKQALPSPTSHPHSSFRCARREIQTLACSDHYRSFLLPSCHYPLGPPAANPIATSNHPTPSPNIHNSLPFSVDGGQFCHYIIPVSPHRRPPGAACRRTGSCSH